MKDLRCGEMLGAVFSADYSAVGLSVRVSLLAALVCLFLGTPVALWLARSRSPGRFVIQLFVLLPLVMPPVAIGFLLLVILNVAVPSLLFTEVAAVIAATVAASPLMIRTAQAAMEAVDPRLGKAAATLGASSGRIFFTITLPLSWRGLVAGFTLAWARAFGEFGATMVVAGNIPGRTRTVPLAIWTALQSPGKSPLFFVVVSILMSVAAVAIGELLVARRPVHRRD